MLRQRCSISCDHVSPRRWNRRFHSSAYQRRKFAEKENGRIVGRCSDPGISADGAGRLLTFYSAATAVAFFYPCRQNLNSEMAVRVERAEFVRKVGRSFNIAERYEDHAIRYVPVGARLQFNRASPSFDADHVAGGYTHPAEGLG